MMSHPPVVTARFFARALLGRVTLFGLVVTVYAAGSTAVQAQSLIAAEGLGALEESLDARARALGSAGVGLTDAHLLEADPSAAAAIFIPTASVTFQTSTSTLNRGGTAGRTRFPALAAAYPYRGNVFSIRAGSFLDQEWEVQFEHTVDVGEIDADVVDRFESSGSVARVSFGWARTLFESAAVGVTFGTYAGTTDREFTRSFDTDDVGVGVLPYRSGGRLQASGLFVGIGGSWDPLPILRVGGAISLSEDLLLSPSDEDQAGKGKYRMPMELRGGGTVALSQTVALHLGVTYSDWSDTELARGESRSSTWSYGGGAEWSGGTLLGRALAMRVGARHRDLPFLFEATPVSEQTLSGGVGMILVDSDELPLALLEFGVERGSREAGAFSEEFWRTAISVTVSAG